MGAPSQIVEPIPPMVSAFTRGWGWVDEGSANTPPISAAWPAANRGLWTPIFVPTTCIATRMWWVNGSTVSATYNVEAGIYYDTGASQPGAKLVTTGSVAQGTASQVQFADITDTRVDGGALYWLYMSCSSASATFFRSSVQSTWDELFLMRQESIGPGSAPGTATPLETSAGIAVLYGFSTNTVT